MDRDGYDCTYSFLRHVYERSCSSFSIWYDAGLLRQKNASFHVTLGFRTHGIAQEIQSQTGADIFEISPVEPYSSDYNTVLMEAQEDQHKQARPQLSGYVDNMDEYDTILLGYPNWWASIPMPIASFLEEYDFSEKRIITSQRLQIVSDLVARKRRLRRLRML